VVDEFAFQPTAETLVALATSFWPPAPRCLTWFLLDERFMRLSGSSTWPTAKPPRQQATSTRTVHAIKKSCSLAPL
jgi:hypothetical protein